MRKYRTPNGTIVTEEYLINRYGQEEFSRFISEGKLQEFIEEPTDAQSGNVYITPNNTEVTEEYLINRYGKDGFNNFLTEGKLKKKGDTASSSEIGSSDSQTTEEDYFTGTFGAILKGVDDFTHLGIGDFIDDMARSVASGYYQGVAAEDASDLLLRGSSASMEDVQSFIDSQKNASQLGASKEMQDYQKTYEENGKGFMGFVMGLIKNPSILPEVALSSLVSIATNTDSLLAAGSVIGAGAGTGAAAGAAAGTVVPLAGTAAGAGVGATLGAAASIPLAFAAANSVLEMGSTFAELLTEEANGRELTPEVIKELLNTPEVYESIRNKSVARGIAIGTIDAFTGKLGGKIGSKVLTKGGEIAAGAATKGRKIASIAAAGGVEAVGGSAGEVAGRLVAGQEMDVSEIALEGIAEAPGSVKDMISARYSKAKYKVNGEEVPVGTVDNLINTMTLDELTKTKFDIQNDYEGRAGKLQNRIKELSTKKQLIEANPELNEPTLNEMTKLQLELDKLEGNKTEVAKAKANDLKAQIKALQETPLAEEVAQEVTTAETEAVTQFNIEEEFDQLTEEEQAPYLEKAQGDKQKAIQLLNDDLALLDETVPAPMEEETAITEEIPALSNIESTADALNELPKNEDGIIEGIPMSQLSFLAEEGVITWNQRDAKSVSEAYHKAKQDGSNPELVQAVEDALVSSKTQTEATPTSGGISVNDTTALSQIRSNTTDRTKLSIIDSAQKAINTLKSVLPNFDIVIHDTEDSYKREMGRLNISPESGGSFSAGRNEDGEYYGVININLNRANSRTVAHEVAHGIMLKTFGESADNFKLFKDRVTKVLNESSNAQLMEFANQYAEIDSYEEFLAELTGALSQQEGKVSPSTLQKIAAIINEFVSKATNGKFTPFKDVRDAKQAIEFFNTISASIRQGEAINPSDIQAIQEGLSMPIGSPDGIVNRPQLYGDLNFPEEPLPLSFVTAADKIDIKALIEDIIAKKQKVWFWMADQLGRGEYYDEVIGKTHYLDAGPSFALDPKNRKQNILWASGLRKKTLADNIKEADYIFFISGSPDKAKLFNKRVINLLEERVNKTSDFKKFKEAINSFPKETVELKTLKDALNKIDSFQELANSSNRKPFLLAISEIGGLKTAPPGSLKELLESFNAFIDYNELRDGFYKENNFVQNDILLVGKPTGIAGKADHSTYEYAIAGEVVGVPDKKVDSWEIMPDSIKEKYKEGNKFIDSKTGKEKTRGKLSPAQKIKIIAAETGIIRQLGPDVKSKAQLVGDTEVVKFIKNARAQGISEAAIKIALKKAGISSDTITTSFEKTKGEAAVRTELSEAFVEGYDRMMDEVDGIIEKSQSRGRTDEEILTNITEYIMGSKVYENATDVQREKLIRDARKMMGVREKSAPSANRLIGIIKDIKNITMSEKELLYKRLKDIQEGAKTAKQAWVSASKQLSDDVAELKKKGKITTSQMADVLSRFSKVNMFNPNSIETFIDYMAKVFNDAEYASKMADANAKRKTALKNVERKIGVSDILVPQLQKIFSVNPSLIPMSVLDKYMSLIDIFGQNKAVLSLPPAEQLMGVTRDIMDAVNEELSVVGDLSDRLELSDNKVYNDDGSLNYSETLKKMLKNDEIDEAELEIMKKYKSRILQAEEGPKMTAAEKQAKEKEEKQKLIAEIAKSDIMQISSLPSRDERKDAGRLEKLIRTGGVRLLSVNDLKNLLKVIDNINNGFFPHTAFVMIEKINGANNAVILDNATRAAKPAPITSLYTRLKSLVTKKGSLVELIRRNPLFYIDQVFGDFKTKDIFNSIFGMASQEISKFRNELKNIQEKINKAEQAVIKSFGNDHNKFVMSKYKQMAYMIQEEFLSNPNSKQVNDVTKFLKKTIKGIVSDKTKFTEADAKMLQKILDDYTDANGNFDNQALYNSFNIAEKKSIETLQQINSELTPKAVYTASVIRGEGIEPLSNYVHLNVINEDNGLDIMSTASMVDNANKRFSPSTRAKSLVKRTGDVSVLDFDVYSSVQKGAKSTLMDYHMTEPIRTARRTLKMTERMIEDDAGVLSKQFKVFNAINQAFDESIRNLLENSYTETSIADDVLDYVKKQGYRAILASAPRFISELTSNVSFALAVDPKGFITGAKMKGFLLSPEAVNVMHNLNSVQTNRVFPTESLSGKLVDTSGFVEVKGTKNGKAKNGVSNFISKMWNKTGQKWVNGVEVAADALISTPDKMVMRPLWFGAFENRFKDITGSAPDFNKISENDEAYMEANKEALKQATELADKRSVMAGATDNAFMGILKGTTKPNQSLRLQAFNAFNNFMTRFLIFEYITARTGVMSLVGRGEMSKKQGAAVIGGVMSRMMVYTLLGQMLAQGLEDMFSDDKDDDDVVIDEKSFDKKLGQAFASSFTSLLFGRDFGNATKGIINLGVEEFNKQQLDFLREGEYDPYKDAIQYTITPTESKGKKTNLGEVMMKLGAAYGPILKTADLIVRKATEPPKKKEDAIKRQEKEKYVRIPLEVLGNLGFIPMYRDIRKIVLDKIYKDLEVAEAKAELGKEEKAVYKEMLQGYDNETDMKRYDRDLWEMTFGQNSAGYDEREAKKEIKRQKRKLKRKMKDEMYNYMPIQNEQTEEKRGIGGGRGIGGRR
jgi:hypothetical protein